MTTKGGRPMNPIESCYWAVMFMASSDLHNPLFVHRGRGPR